MFMNRLLRRGKYNDVYDHGSITASDRKARTEKGLGQFARREKMTFITEELGEVAKWVRKNRKRRLTRVEFEELNFEVADVLQHTVSLADSFGLDLEAGLVKKKGACRPQGIQPPQQI